MHNKIISEVFKELKSSGNGLSQAEVEQRLKQYGLNEIKEGKKASALEIFLNQFKSAVLWILIIATVISTFLKEYIDAIVILVIIVLIAVLGFILEYRAERAIEALKKLASLKATAVRDGQKKEIDANQLVPGDIIVLETGDKVPADSRLLEIFNLQTQEAALTGESSPVSKDAKELPEKTPIADMKNMAFSGTIVVSGRAKAIVVATGMRTEIGKIAKMIEDVKPEPTPLQKKMDYLGKWIAKIVMAVAVVIFIVATIFQEKSLIENLIVAVAVAVAAIPEALLAIVTMALAIGTQRMLKRNALVRRLPSVETLGSTTVICVPGDTPIICNPSIKSIDSINVGDKVLGYDGNFHDVIRTYKRNYSGKIIRIKPMGLPELKITPEHPILVASIKRHRPVFRFGNTKSRPRKIEILKPRWVDASNVGKNDFVVIPRVKEEKQFSLKFRKGRERTKTEVPIDEELAELLGWYLAEGCTSSYEGGYHIKFYLGKNEQENVKRVKHLIETKLGLKAYVYQTRTSISIEAINQDLVRFLKNNFGDCALNKRIPEFILHSPKDIICKFLEGYLKGDGNIDDYYIRFVTISKTLTYQLIVLLAKLGIRARLHIRKGGIGTIEGRKVNIKDSYEIFISGSQADIIHPSKVEMRERKKNLFLFDEDFVYVPIRNVKNGYESLDVFNIETSSQTYTLPFVVHNCSDKTGTLTANEMTVRKLFVNGRVIDVTGVGYDTKGQFLFRGKSAGVDDIELLLRIGALNNNAELRNSNLFGDPTEGALIVSAAKAGLIKEELEIECPRIDEIEFTSERKMMTTIHKRHGEKLAYVKGAPEVVLRLCSYIYLNEKAMKLTEEMKEEILEANKSFGDEALRVLGFAYKTIIADKEPEKNLIFVGLQGMIDPAREEVKIAIEKCRKAGIKVIMITGDHEVTARAVAKEIGLGGKVVTGQQLDEIKNLEDWVEDIAIYARVNPEHKIRIVDALKKKGHVVAMTGDGVNDAPALKKADIGIAMGITGTDVSKEASAMILTDDNFASIVNAVEEGRGVYGNIRKYIGFLLSGNIGEVLIIFLGIIFGLPLPLTATQILLINLVTDGLPALALSADPYEPNAMSRKPRKQDEPIFKGLNPFLVYYPIVMTVVALAVFSWFYFYNDNLFQAQTATFLTISMFELYQALASRSTIYPAFKVGIFKNKFLILAVLSSFTVIAASIFIPSFGKFLDMTPLGVFEFLFIVLISSIGAIIIELCKYFKTRNEIIEVNI